MTKSKLLTGKVAELLGQYRIAINIGKNSGVEKDMEFIVLGVKSILDPDSHKKLGTYKYHKVRVQVVQVEDDYSVATTKSTEPVIFGSLNAWPYPKVTRQKLSSKETTLDRDVAVGDVVVQAKE